MTSPSSGYPLLEFFCPALCSLLSNIPENTGSMEYFRHSLRSALDSIRGFCGPRRTNFIMSPKWCVAIHLLASVPPLTSPKINKGATGARADDTKALKSAIIDWIAPPGGYISPPLSRNVKTDRGFFHTITGALLCPATLDWDDAP